MEKEPRVPYASKNGRIVFVDDVPNGLDCGCVCPKCGQALIARQGDIRTHHFAHHGDQQCMGAYEVTLYRLAIQILKDEQRVMAPTYKGVVPAGPLYFRHVEVEEQDWGISIRPDVVGTYEDGTTICIGIRCAITADEKKFSRLVKQNTRCLEIDIHECPMDESELRRFLLESEDSRRWLKHSEYERIFQEKEAKREAKRREEEAERVRKWNERKSWGEGHIVRLQAPFRKPIDYRGQSDKDKREESVEEVKMEPLPEVTALKEGPIKDYLRTLHPNGNFEEYTEAPTIILNYGLSYSCKSIYVIHVNQSYIGNRLPFHLSRVTYKNGEYVIEHIGRYQSEIIAEKALSKRKNDLYP